MKIDPEMVVPTEGRVLLEQLDSPEKRGELYLSDRERSRSSRARVIFSPECLEAEGIREGMQVLCPRGAGKFVSLNGKGFQIVSPDDLLAEIVE